MEKKSNPTISAAPDESIPLSEQSTATLIRSVVTDARELLGKELQAARLEVKAEAKKLKEAVIATVTAGTVLLVGAMLSAMALAQGLAATGLLSQWAGFAAVGSGLVVLGVGLLRHARRKIEQHGLFPAQTAEEMDRDRNELEKQVSDSSLSRVVDPRR